MRTIITGLLAAAIAGTGLAACGGDDEESTPSTTSSPEVVFSVNLTGADEVPQPGSADGRGTARITVNPNGTEVCYELTVTDLADVTAAHIHEGRSGTAGPIAVTLDAPTDGQSEGCVQTSASIVDGMTGGNRSFYVNIHTTEFPDGAVRAQLTG
jgi:hypothetical protein